MPVALPADAAKITEDFRFVLCGECEAPVALIVVPASRERYVESHRPPAVETLNPPGAIARLARRVGVPLFVEVECVERDDQVEPGIRVLVPVPPSPPFCGVGYFYYDVCAATMARHACGQNSGR